MSDPLVDELVAALKECRNATAAAMRVIAEIDAGTLIGLPADTATERFVDELHVSGVRDGFGKRADDLLARLETR